MIKIAICDDSEYIRKQNENLLVKYSIQKGFDFVISQFENGESLLEKIDDFDLVFLDYQFEDKGADGMEIAKAIRKKNKDITIVFLTSYTGVVFETFEVSAFRFLIKPLDEEKLFSTMDDYVKTLVENDTFMVKVSGVNHYIKEKYITYIEASGKNSIIHFINKSDTLECGETLLSIEARVSKKHFFRCHKSFLINMKYVESFSHNDIVLENNEIVAISRQKYKSFNNAYTDYLVKI